MRRILKKKYLCFCETLMFVFASYTYVMKINKLDKTENNVSNNRILQNILR